MKKIVLVSLVVLSIFFLYSWVVIQPENFANLKKPGSFSELGESLAAIDGLFGAIAIILAFIAIVLQGKELKDATAAFEAQTKASHDQTEEIKAQTKSAQEQLKQLSAQTEQFEKQTDSLKSQASSIAAQVDTARCGILLSSTHVKISQIHQSLDRMSVAIDANQEDSRFIVDALHEIRGKLFIEYSCGINWLNLLNDAKRKYKFDAFDQERCYEDLGEPDGLTEMKSVRAKIYEALKSLKNEQNIEIAKLRDARPNELKDFRSGFRELSFVFNRRFILMQRWQSEYQELTKIRQHEVKLQNQLISTTQN